MMNSALRAHERLLISGNLKIRTHIRPAPPEPNRQPKKHLPPRIKIDGVVYPSTKVAAKKLRIGVRTVYLWLASGKATRVEKE